jgi:hypothetical protein
MNGGRRAAAAVLVLVVSLSPLSHLAGQSTRQSTTTESCCCRSKGHCSCCERSAGSTNAGSRLLAQTCASDCRRLALGTQNSVSAAPCPALNAEVPRKDSPTWTDFCNPRPESTRLCPSLRQRPPIHGLRLVQRDGPRTGGVRCQHRVDRDRFQDFGSPAGRALLHPPAGRPHSLPLPDHGRRLRQRRSGHSQVRH